MLFSITNTNTLLSTHAICDDYTGDRIQKEKEPKKKYNIDIYITWYKIYIYDNFT